MCKLFLTIAAALTATILIGLALPSEAEAAGLLISKGKPASASSKRSGNPARKANDGNLTSRWVARNGNFPQWWRVNLLGVRRVSNVTIKWHNPAERPRTFACRIETSLDRRTWTTFAPGARARYVRVYITGLTSGRGWAGLREVKVFGAAAATLPARGGLVMSTADITRVRGHVAAGRQPWAAAWNAYRPRVSSAMSITPQVFRGPGGATGPGTLMERQFDRDGHAVRDLGIGYMIARSTANATKAKRFLLAWASGNRPSAFGNNNDSWGGSYVSHGLFGFAFGYELTKSSGVYSSADKAAIRAWFRRWVDALQTYLVAQRRAYVFAHPSMTSPYMWSQTYGLRFHEWDRYVGGDGPAMTMVAQLALAIESGYSAALARIFNPANTFSVQNIIKASCRPRNGGDHAGTCPVPQVQIFKPGSGDNPGRGGNVDYMTYNARAVAIIYEMARGIGKATATQDGMLRTSFMYLSRFFGSDARTPVAPNDTLSRPVCLSRMQIAKHLWGDPVFISDVAGQTNLIESQFLGPTILTQP